MKTEQVILSLVAILAGLLVAGVGFYFYQSTKTISSPTDKSISISPPSPTPPQSSFLTVSSPADEEVVDKKIITISGHTTKDAIIIINTPVSDQVVTPATSGNFSTTATIDDGENFVEITAVLPNGTETTETRTVTYSTENF